MRLIDADELKEYTSFLKSRCIPDSEPYKMYESLERMIDKSPVIDAEPVKHGHWIPCEDLWGDIDLYKCSNCGCDWTFIEGTPEDNDCHYCPHCGAKMDEVEE